MAPMRTQAPLNVVPIAIIVCLCNLGFGQSNPVPPVGNGKAFDPGCELPFQSIAKKHPIDDICDINGKPRELATYAETHQQELAKNNFCAQDPATVLYFHHFMDLQTEVKERGIDFGKDHLPKERSKLKDLIDAPNGVPVGEGKMVSLTGFLNEPHYSDTDHGESVNCNIPDDEFNDIHMSLSKIPFNLPKGPSNRPQRTAMLCKTITAEITPHFRPELWEVDSLKLIGNERSVRITGQLFFDASHVPCEKNGTIAPRNPARATLWEIHPVYEFEVCSEKNVRTCSGGHWIPLAEWAKGKIPPSSQPLKRMKHDEEESE